MIEKVYSDGAVYLGETDGHGNPCGHGTLTFDDGRVFCGRLDYISQRGCGVWRYPDGSSLRGGFTVCPENPSWFYRFADGREVGGIVCNFISDEERHPTGMTDTDTVCAELTKGLAARGLAIEFNARALLADTLLLRGDDAETATRTLTHSGSMVTVPDAMRYLFG